MKLNFTWKKRQDEYSSGETLYLNRIRVGSYCWNVARSKGDTTTPDWNGDVNLPSVKPTPILGTQAEVKAKMETIVQGWFDEALKGSE